MNIKQLSFWLLLAASNTVFPETSCVSHMFVPRGASTDLVWVDALTYRFRNETDKKFIWVGTTIYQQSTHSKRFASSFLLGNGSDALLVTQGGVTGTAVNSIELGLANPAGSAPFSSSLRIKPTRKQFTYLGYFYADLSDWWCGLWGDAVFGVTNAHHRLACCELGNTSSLCSGIATVSDALEQPGLLYSKFYCDGCHEGKRRTGFEDVQLRLGYNIDWCLCNNLSVYVIGTIPAGRGPNARYIFEPLVGSKHASIGVGLIGDYQFDFCGCQDHHFTLMSDFNYRYVFNHRECRTFDLLPAGPFSRYILLVDQSAPGLPFPAANATTSYVKVEPRSTIQWWLGLNYEYCDWNLEVGYNLFWRQKERLKECVPLSTTLGIYNVNGCGTAPFTASTATMTNPGTADGVFVGLSQANLNIASGLAGRLLSNKVYAAVSWDGCLCNGCFEWMTGFGASYEFVVNHDKCNAPNAWAVFGKFGLGF